MMPWIESSHTETPSPVNPLGVKGVGEAGTIGCSPAVVNSVVDALSPLGRAAHRHAAHARKNLEARFSKEATHDSAEFRIFRSRQRWRRRWRCSPTASAKVLAGGMSLIPLMKLRLAAPEHVVDLGRVPGLNYIARRAAASSTSAPWPRTTRSKPRPWCAASARCWPRPRRTSATCRCATWAPSAAASPTPIRRPIIPPRCWRSKPRCAWPARTASARWRSSDFFVDTFTTALEPGEIVLRDHRARGAAPAQACLTRRCRSRPPASPWWAWRRASRRPAAR